MAKTSQSSAPEASGVPSAQEARRYYRRSVLWSAVMLVGEHKFACQIWNLSLGGARVRIDIPLMPGTPVLLSVQGREDLAGHVVWCREQSMGVKFDTPEARVREIFKDRLHALGLDAETVIDPNAPEEDAASAN